VIVNGALAVIEIKVAWMCKVYGRRLIQVAVYSYIRSLSSFRFKANIYLEVSGKAFLSVGAVVF
jgi:hypothetical protein